MRAFVFASANNGSKRVAVNVDHGLTLSYLFEREP